LQFIVLPALVSQRNFLLSRIEIDIDRTEALKKSLEARIVSLE